MARPGGRAEPPPSPRGGEGTKEEKGWEKPPRDSGTCIWRPRPVPVSSVASRCVAWLLTPWTVLVPGEMAGKGPHRRGCSRGTDTWKIHFVSYGGYLNPPR